MEMKSTVEKAKSLLNDGGKLLIVGLAAPSGFCDYIIEALRVIPCFIISKIKRMKTSESRNIPVSYAFPDMNEVRRVLGELLPGHTLRYGLFYRYLLTWEKNL